MAASIVSSIIFFLLFIILSLFVDGKAFAAQMEHRKLSGSNDTMTMRRSLEGNGSNRSRMATPGSTSPQARVKPKMSRPKPILIKPRPKGEHGIVLVTMPSNELLASLTADELFASLTADELLASLTADVSVQPKTLSTISVHNAQAGV